ncbi:MAG: L,D-transpeptidase family protein [Hyphomicrobiaceae bacterium]
MLGAVSSLLIAALLVVSIAASADASSKRKKKEKEPEQAEVAPRFPLNLVVSTADQKVYVYHGTELLESSPVSTGQRAFPTPTGVFSILAKSRHHYSNLYGGAPMPWMQRLTWTGTALHQGHLPGYAASHGCIRMPGKFASHLFRMTRMNTHVIVTAGHSAPSDISHPLLFNPAPVPKLTTGACDGCATVASTGEVAVAAASVDVEEGEASGVVKDNAPLRMLIARSSERDIVKSLQTMLSELQYEIGEIDGFIGPQTRKIMRVYQRIHGLKETDDVSTEVLDHLSRATGRGPARAWHIFVKQDFKDLFSAPVEVVESDEPMGTHLYQALSFASGDTTVRWVAMPGDPMSEDISASAVLDRITIPDETRTRIASLLTPGSSLIVTDRGKSEESNFYTAFIVRTPAIQSSSVKKARASAAVDAGDVAEDQPVKRKRRARASRTSSKRAASVKRAGTQLRWKQR